MPNYSTQLKTWGSAGSEYPNGYQYKVGENPVDAWDNFVISNIIKDIKHLISVTNNDLLTADGSTPITGDLDLNGNELLGTTAIRAEAGQSLTLETGNGGNIVVNDKANGEVLASFVEGVGLRMFGGDIDLRGSSLIDSIGTNNQIDVTTGNALTGGGTVSLGGSITIDVDETGISHDNLSNVSADDHHTRYTDSEARSAVNNANVDIAGDANSVGGQTLGGLDSRYYQPDGTDKFRVEVRGSDPTSLGASDNGRMWLIN